MNAKNLMVCFVLALFLLTGFAAVNASGLVNNTTVKVNGIDAVSNTVSVVAGKDIIVNVFFTANKSDSDVTVELTLEGRKIKSLASSDSFDVIAGNRYVKTLTLKVPYELKDSINDTLALSVEVKGNQYSDRLSDIALTVQRPSYNAEVKSVTTPSSINAGETFPIEIVLKNMGYNSLDDVYVSAKITSLGVSQGPKWFGDLRYLKDSSCCDKNEDTAVGKLSLTIPYSAKAGIYSLEVLVKNDDTETKVVKQVVITNSLTENVISTSTTKTVAEGENAVYDLLIVNPTNNVKVYRIITDSTEIVSSANQAVIAIPAGSSKTVKITASSDVAGNYAFNASVFEGESLLKTAPYNLIVKKDGKKSTNTVFILTIVLAAVFVILLVALIMLLGKKPEKSEEFGESYY